MSTDAQTTENQLLQLRAVAERHGWAIVAEFVDQGISGAKGRQERRQFDALLNGVARREFDMIAAWSVDRLGLRKARSTAYGASRCDRDRTHKSRSLAVQDYRRQLLGAKRLLPQFARRLARYHN